MPCSIFLHLKTTAVARIFYEGRKTLCFLGNEREENFETNRMLTGGISVCSEITALNCSEQQEVSLITPEQGREDAPSILRRNCKQTCWGSCSTIISMKKRPHSDKKCVCDNHQNIAKDVSNSSELSHPVNMVHLVNLHLTVICIPLFNLTSTLSKLNILSDSFPPLYWASHICGIWFDMLKRIHLTKCIFTFTQITHQCSERLNSDILRLKGQHFIPAYPVSGL